MNVRLLFCCWWSEKNVRILLINASGEGLVSCTPLLLMVRRFGDMSNKISFGFAGLQIVAKQMVSLMFTGCVQTCIHYRV